MLILKRLRFKNLLSFGNDFTTIDFDNQKSILVQGNNGSGKSAAILDSLSYGLYNRPFRKINRPNLINYRNKKELIVEVWFTTETGKEYHVIRGLNPQVFEIYENDVLISQNSAIRDYQEILEKQILRLDFQAFTQIVVLGKATYIAFLRLQPQDRRRFIENVLNLSIFGQMNEINKIRINELKNQQQEIRIALGLLKQEIELTQKHIQDFEEEAIRQQLEHERVINEQIDLLVEKNTELEERKEELQRSMRAIADDLSTWEQKVDLCYEYQSRFHAKLRESQKRLAFFSENTVCPTCESTIDNETRNSKIESIEEEQSKIQQAQVQLEKKLETLVDVVSNIRSDLNFNSKIQEEIKLIDHSIQQNTQSMLDLERRKTTPPSSHVEKIRSTKDHLESLVGKREQKNEERTQLNAKMDCHEFITAMLKDTGIKSAIIRSYIPQITTIMNTHLRSLGLFVRFELNENFEERLYSRGIDELGYQSFSEGEKLRIDLAMLLTWREICKRKNNMDVNFLIFDEILDASLDENGAESLVTLFKELSYQGVKIIVISHSSEKWEEKFNETWVVEKRSGFSYIQGNRTVDILSQSN